jgi:hypothetical protein
MVEVRAFFCFLVLTFPTTTAIIGTTIKKMSRPNTTGDITIGVPPLIYSHSNLLAR